MRANAITLFTVVALALSACAHGRSGATHAGDTRRALAGQHGGAVATSAGVTTEVVVQPNGHFSVYVADALGALDERDLSVLVRDENGLAHAIVVSWDATEGAYQGVFWGMDPGAKTVSVAVPAAVAGAPPRTTTAPVAVPAVVPTPHARFGGTVQIAGLRAMELVPAANGTIAIFLMTLDGSPLPLTDAPHVEVSVYTPGSGRPPAPVALSALYPANDHYIAQANPAQLRAGSAIDVRVDLPGVPRPGTNPVFTRVAVSRVALLSTLPSSVSTTPTGPAAIASSTLAAAPAPIAHSAPAAPVADTSNARVVAPSTAVASSAAHPGSVGTAFAPGSTPPVVTNAPAPVAPVAPPVEYGAAEPPVLQPIPTSNPAPTPWPTPAYPLPPASTATVPMGAGYPPYGDPRSAPAQAVNVGPPPGASAPPMYGPAPVTNPGAPVMARPAGAVYPMQPQPGPAMQSAPAGGPYGPAMATPVGRH